MESVRMNAGADNDDRHEESSEIGRERLQKILSSYGVSSRREAETMIVSGRVKVNGITAKLGQSAIAGKDEITVDGTLLVPRGQLIYIMLNKPRGYVTTMKDEFGRKTVAGLVSGLGSRVYPAGRLDRDSEGLLIMTNDGRFANIVTHPSYNKEKVYEVVVRGDAAGAERLLMLPMVVDSHEVQAVSARLLSCSPGGGVLRITVSEGRNRQIRKMCANCRLIVKALKRVSIGPLELGGLEPGQWRYLTEEETGQLMSVSERGPLG